MASKDDSKLDPFASLNDKSSDSKLDPFASLNDKSSDSKLDPFASLNDKSSDPFSALNEADPFEGLNDIVEPPAISTATLRPPSVSEVIGPLPTLKELFTSAEAENTQSLQAELDRKTDALREAEKRTGRSLHVKEDAGRSIPGIIADKIQAPFRLGVALTESALDPFIDPVHKATKAESYGDLLFKVGMTTKLSDIPIANLGFERTPGGFGISQNSPFNLYLSSVLGFPLDIAADPTTYVTFGTGGLVGSGVRVASKYGPRYLSHTGKKALTAAEKAEMPQALKIAKRIARDADRTKELAGDVSPEAARFAKTRGYTDINPEVFGQTRSIGMHARELARRKAANRIVAAGDKMNPEFLHQGGIQFMGRPIIAGEHFKPVASQATRVIRYLDQTPAGNLVFTGVRKAHGIADNLFSAVRQRASKSPGFLEEIARYRGRQRYLRSNYAKMAQEWGKSLQGKTADGQYLVSDYITLHRNDPVKYPAENLPQAARDLNLEMSATYTESQALGIDLEIHGQDWVTEQPMFFKNTEEQLQQLTLESVPMPGRTRSIGKYTGTNLFRTFEEVQAAHAAATAAGKITWKLKPVTDAVEIASVYFDNFGRSLAIAEHATRVKKHLGVTKERVAAETFRRAFPEVDRLIRGESHKIMDGLQESTQFSGTSITQPLGPTNTLIQQVGEALADPSLSTAELKKLLTDPAARSLFVLGVLRRAGNMTEMDDAIEHALNFSKDGSIDPQLHLELQDIFGRHQHDAVNSWKTPYGKVQLEKTTLGRGTEEFWLPQDVSDDFTRALNTGDIPGNVPGLREVVSVWDMVEGNFRGALTAWPSTWAKNAYTDTHVNILDIGLQAFNTGRMKRLYKVFNGMDGTIKTPSGKRIPNSEIRQLLKEGVWTDSKALLDSPNHSNLFTGTFRSQLFNKLETKAPLLTEGSKNLVNTRKWGPGVNAFRENWAKGLLYLTYIERGWSHDQAVLRINKWMNDVDELSPFEKVVMKRAKAFYTYTRKITELMARNFAHRPGLTLAYEHMGDRDRGPERDALPDYLSGKFKIRSKTENGLTYLHGIDMPQRIAAEELWSGSWGKSAKHHMSSMAPFITYLGQGVTQQYWYSGKDFPKREMVPDFIEHIMKLDPWMKEFFEFDTEPDPANPGQNRFTINGTKYYLFANWAALARISTQSRRYQQDPELDRSLINMLSGFQWKTLDDTKIGNERTRKKIAAKDVGLTSKSSSYREKTITYPIKRDN